jgi:HK97 family phage portal protein
VLDAGLKYNRIPMNLDDAQFIDSHKLNRDEICGLFRVPPHMVANLEKATFSNIEELALEFIVFNMMPMIVRFEKAMNWKLFTPAERAAGYYVKFNIDALLRGNAKARAEALEIKRRNGVVSADEWRELDDENPIGGITGGAYLVNGAMTSTELAATIPPRRTGETGGDSR